eukprot:Skav200299  [mRNA]  locus=scaffold4329:52211:53725:- [translate_table: standard]
MGIYESMRSCINVDRGLGLGVPKDLVLALEPLEVVPSADCAALGAAVICCPRLLQKSSDDVAHKYFKAAAWLDDPLGHNGLGFIYFQGIKNSVEPDPTAAFEHFNRSAHRGNADGMLLGCRMWCSLMPLRMGVPPRW